MEITSGAQRVLIFPVESLQVQLSLSTESEQ